MEAFWTRFRLDPRRADNARMRASDADREVVRTVLTDAFADGRLTREEHDERVATLLEARTLGELPGLVDDLVAVSPVPAETGENLPETLSFHEQGVAAYRKELQEALATFVMVNLITWGIWLFTTGPDGYPWPIYPMFFLVVHLLSTGIRREAIVAREVHRLEKKAAKKAAKQASQAEIEAAGETAAPILDPPAGQSEEDRPADPR